MYRPAIELKLFPPGPDAVAHSLRAWAFRSILPPAGRLDTLAEAPGIHHQLKQGV